LRQVDYGDKTMNEDADKPTLIYIMGDGRSGSTALNIILGAHPEIAGVGELSKWAQYGGFPKPGDDKAADHAFWEAVRAQYFAVAPGTSLNQIAAIQREIENYKNFPRIALGMFDARKTEVYYAHVHNLLTAVRRVSRKPVIADSSKPMGVAYLLLRCPRIRARIALLTRHPCGVVWSQMKRGVEQKRKPLFTAILHYAAKNLMCAVVHWRAPRGAVMCVRYEELITAPRRTLERIGKHVGLSMTEVIEAIEKDKPLPVYHLIDGNRIRRANEIQLRLDDEWRTGLSRFQKALVVLLTFPFILAYGCFNGKTREGSSALHLYHY
jgi:hypothetical protein